jgi:hypothetical protein
MGTAMLQFINLRFQVRQLKYDVTGTHLFALTADGQEIAARRIRVYRIGESP